MSPRRATTATGELWRGYRRPVRRDRALWLAIGLCVIVVVIEFALSSPTTPLGWLAFGLLAAAMVVLIVSLTGVFVGVFRGFADGWRSNRAKGPGGADAPGSAPSGSSGPDGAANQRVATDPPTPTPRTDESAPTFAVPPVPESVKNLAAAAQAKAPKQADVDRTARALGRAASAARRAYRKDD